MATRALFIQSSTFTIASYTTQTTLVPVYTLKLLEKVTRGFLWGDYPNSPKLHTIAWHKICQPKDRGGLGLINMQMTNSIALTQTVWQMLWNRDQLWSRVASKMW